MEWRLSTGTIPAARVVGCGAGGIALFAMATSTRTHPQGAPAAGPTDAPKAKRASTVADRIIKDVIAGGWQIGQILGSEAELLAKYRVSRAVFREAVRLVEHQQVATTRRGPGGGLVVTEPTVDAVIDAVVLYLYRAEARLDEVFEARLVLEDIAAGLAPARLEEQDLARLRAFAEGAQPLPPADPRALHGLVAAMSRNPAVELFVDVLTRVAMLYSSGWEDFGPVAHAETTHAHARIAQAVMSGDASTAQHRMRRHLEAEADYLRGRSSTRQLLPGSAVVLSQSGKGKRAEAVARRITQQLMDDGLQPGQLVGTEPELIAREGVSRAVFREAVRLLEHHQIARMRRGPGGGLFVFVPSAAAVSDVAAIYLARRGMRLSDLAEVRTGVEVAIAGLAAVRVDADGAVAIKDALNREAKTPLGADDRPGIVHGLHAAVAAAAGNRVLELIALVLIRLSLIYQIERLAKGARKQTSAEVLRAHEGIAAAVEAGDRELALHRMRRHLDALGALMR
jgi:DNA-binding FadR family transcriptional regulator